MEPVLSQLAAGFVQVAQPATLLALVLGSLAGLAAAALPGLTLVAGMAIVMPFTLALAPASAMVLVTAMYVSGTCAGAWASILFRAPDDAAAVALLWDGQPMARAGHAREALGWALVAAACGAALAGVTVVALAQPLANIVLHYGAPEHFAASLLGLACAVALAGGPAAYAFLSLAAGLALTLVGSVPDAATSRTGYGGPAALPGGIDLLPALLGVYGLAGVLLRSTRAPQTPPPQARQPALRPALPPLRAVAGLHAPLLRGSLVGVLIGAVPGAPGALAAFTSYRLERRYGERPGRMGKGTPEGIVAPQAAATAAACAGLIPLFALGIPVAGPTAIILGTALLHGEVQGPVAFHTAAEPVYAAFAALFAGIPVMAAAGYLAAGALTRLRRIPETAVSAGVAACCLIGGYAAGGLPGLWVTAAAGLVGYGFARLQIPITPMVLGFFLGRLAETSLAAAVEAHHHWSIVFARPLSASLMGAAVLILVIAIVRGTRRTARR